MDLVIVSRVADSVNVWLLLTRYLLQGSGSEERPDSPSDSLDGTKKGERKKEFVCQVGLPLQHFAVLNLN